MYVPKEIIDLIDPSNLNLFKTTKQLYSFIDLFGRNHTVDYQKYTRNIKFNNRIFRIINFDGSTNELHKI
jgi:hypothetical protein